MKEYINKDIGLVRLYPSDWRFSAAIVGLLKFAETMGISDKVTIEKRYIEYKESDILDKELYLECLYTLYGAKYKFKIKKIEDFFEQYKHLHDMGDDEKVEIAAFLQGKSYSKNGKVLFNPSKTVKKYFEDVELNFDDEEGYLETRSQILEIVKNNRYNMLRENVFFHPALYPNYVYKNAKGTLHCEDIFQIFDIPVCRLSGYYFDFKRKKVAYSWSGNANSIFLDDIPEFDFIILAFNKESKGSVFFINNNYSIKTLIAANNEIEGNGDKQSLLEKVWNIANNTYQNVEIIIKASTDNSAFKCFFIGPIQRNILNKSNISETTVDVLKFKSFEFAKDFYIHFDDEIVQSISDNKSIEGLLLKYLKSSNPNKNIGFALAVIETAILKKGRSNMSNIYAAKKTAQEMVKKFSPAEVNSIESIRNQLLNMLAFKRKEQFYQLLIKLSSKTGVSISFAEKLFEDFDENINIAYAFVSYFIHDNKAEKNMEEINND